METPGRRVVFREMSDKGPVKLCKRGHPRTPENVRSNGTCRLCQRERDRTRSEEKREYMREYTRRPEVRRHRVEYRQRPEVREREHERQRKYDRWRRQTSERREYERQRSARRRAEGWFLKYHNRRANARDRQVIDELIRDNPWVLETPELKECLNGTQNGSS